MARVDLRELPMRRIAHGALVERCWALRTHMTTYDAAYCALAELLDVVLVTADAKLAATPGTTCAVEVVR